MAVLVKPNGLLGRGYMAAIRPFRHLIVYPALIRQTGQAWHSRPGPAPARTLPTPQGIENDVRSTGSARPTDGGPRPERQPDRVIGGMTLMFLAWR